MTTEDKEEITNDDEYKLYFVEQQNGPRRRVQHGDVTLHGVLEKLAPDGRVIAKTPLGRIDVASLDYESVSDRDEFWKISDLYINLFDMPTEAAELIREYLSQVVKPVTESEMIFHYCGVSTWVE
jgi:hypothetical protein